MAAYISAIIFAVLIGAVILFQLALAAGMPWGSLAMGGKFPGKLPRGMRAACVLQIIVLALLATIVLTDSGLADWYSFPSPAIWLVVAFSVTASVLNLLTKSVWERRIWAPVSLMLLVASVVVACG